jgi:hypothetical protein
MMMLATDVSNELGCDLQITGPHRGPILMLRQAYYSQHVAAGCYNLHANSQLPIFHPGFGSISCQYCNVY